MFFQIVRKVVVISLLFSMGSVYAETPLTVASVKRLGAASEQMEAVDDKYPELKGEEFESTFMKSLSDGGTAFVEYLSKTPAYGDVSSIAKKNGFGSVESMMSVMFRIGAAEAAVQYEAHPEWKQRAQQAKAMMQSNDFSEMRQQMIDAGMAEEEVNEQIKHTADETNKMNAMVIAIYDSVKKVSDADKKFAKENAALITAVLHSEDEDDEGENEEGY